jgi:uncharacterized protein (DUF486 family)
LSPGQVQYIPFFSNREMAGANLLILSIAGRQFQLPTRDTISGAMKTVLLLICSNIFMTIAWYGHLKYRRSPLFAVIVVSWLIAFVEYCFQVPANRIGYAEFTGFQLKIIQEVITLCVFVVFAQLYLGEKITWNYSLAFLCMLGAVAFAFWGKL